MPDKPPRIDITDSGAPADDPLKPLNLKEKSDGAVAVAIETNDDPNDIPRISAAGRGKIAEQILQLAFANGIKVREDKALAEMLAQIELDSPIPSEAFLAVAEVLSYVYRANNQPNPFDAVFPIEESE
ncbi:MAG: hypothetical protein GC136_04500 [Alphaproteobacteria bacterium]|nr:hypothetical protein [Alphaproteobacteria bacterium]